MEYRPYKRCKASKLLEIARRDDTPLQKLEDFIEELSQRRNWHAQQVQIEIGKIHEKKRIRYTEKRREAEREEDERKREGYFEWPSTDAPMSHGAYIPFSYKEGLLSFVGYKVGLDGTETVVRRQILDCVFHKDLPDVNDQEYMEEWSQPESSDRLRKMADTIAALTRGAKRNTSADYSKAIEDWEQDLEHLYNKYYIDYFHYDEHYTNHFHFDWPDYS